MWNFVIPLAPRLSIWGLMMTRVTLREDYDSATVRRLASRCDDADQARRLLSIAAVYDGMSRTDAARIGGMDRQTLRDWSHRFNEEGLSGLVNRKAPGAPVKLTVSQLAELAALVEDGPDPAGDGVVRWRCLDLKIWIEDRFRGCLSRTLGVAVAARVGLFACQRPAPPCGTSARGAGGF